ncbi:MAG TPA: pectate lyase [Polyangiaceae bacterium]|jgi:hypothetical protein|nr:pectate lyase [Polyangiaceae bacterium]
MKRSSLLCLVSLLVALPLACSAANGNTDSNEGGTDTGGVANTSGTGGSVTTSTGGVANSGGITSSTGGVASTGGIASTGGTPNTGGITGGSNNTGGSTSGGKATGGAGSGGSKSSGGASTGGKAATGGGASGGATAGGSTNSSCKPWPAAAGSQSVSATIPVSGSYDGMLKRFTGTGNLGGSGQEEGQDPLFELADGATLKNVIIGAPAADGVHCKGTCTLQNVWWEDVGEDAATSLGSSSSVTMTIDCAGAKSATDKVLQHNGGGTMVIKNFWVQTFGKLYRSCGNCSSQYTRHATFENIVASGGSVLAGVNETYNDTATFKNITITGNIGICDRYQANNTGAEPTKTGSGADGKYCIYSAADIHMQ